MTVDHATRQWLNLLKQSPRTVLRDKPDGGAHVLSVERIPDNDGFYWVHGKTLTRAGREVESVFRVDTDSGGELYEVFWFIDGEWHDYRNAAAREVLGGDDEVFPFDWEYSVPLTRDVHHS